MYVKIIIVLLINVNQILIVSYVIHTQIKYKKKDVIRERCVLKDDKKKVLIGMRVDVV